MKTLFPKNELHIPKWYVIDAKNKPLGRLSTEISKLLRGKETSFFTPGVDQGNFVVILNADKIEVTGKKSSNKLYYRNSQRPGSLKIETLTALKKRIPTRILEKSIWGMLPKGVLGRKYFRRLYLYTNDTICYKNFKTEEKNIPINTKIEENWIKINL